MRLISAIPNDLCQAHGGSNSCDKPTASGTKMEQWSVTLLPVGKPRAVDSMVSCSEVDVFIVVSAYVEP